MASKVQDCDCGFIDSHDRTKSIFTSFLVVNFSSITSKQLHDLFILATYDIGRGDGPYARNFSANQVQLSEAGLNLTVSPSPDSKSVPCGQATTKAATFFHGSYHAQFRVGDVPGTVTAFFNYKNDSSEVDIEYLSTGDHPTLLYTVKPQIYLDNGNPSNSTDQQETWDDTSVSFDQDFHEWSFVWLPDIVHFGLDATYSRFITTNVPQVPGRLALSHWSDGNPKYSLGPPMQNSTVTISLLWAVYNDTKASALTCKKATSACTVANGTFQASTALGEHISDSATFSSVVVVNSAHFIAPAAPCWLLVLFFFSWFSCWRCFQ
jgi:beta-glucanase (GH16 family)